MFNKTEPLDFNSSLDALDARNQLQQLKVTGSQVRPSNAAPNPVPSAGSLTSPQHVQNVQVKTQKTSDITSKVTVTYQRNPQDYQFVDTRVFVSGYKGNPAPVQVASGVSPVSFSLENTGEPVAVTVQSSGNLGQAPISTAPTATLQLVKTPLATTPTPAGNGTGGGGSSAEVGTSTSKFWGGRGEPNPELVGTTATLSASTNKVSVCRFKLCSKCLVRSITWTQASTSVGHNYSFGIYDANGNLLLQTTFLSTSSSGPINATITPVQLNSADYYFAWVDESGGFISIKGISLDDQFNQILNFDTVPPFPVAFAANNAVAGVLPSALGALTANSLPLSHSIPAVLFSA